MDTGKKPRGRPAYPPGEARRGSVHIRLTPGERTALETLAGRVGLSLSEFIRKSLGVMSGGDRRKGK